MNSTKKAKQAVLFGFLCSLLWGCLSADTYYRRVDLLEPGMARKEALSVMGGSPSAFRFDEIPEVKIYQFKICPASQECRFERLVFSNDRYVGKGLDPEEMLRGEKIQVEMSRADLALLGAIPDTIRHSPPGLPPQELWAYRYLAGGVYEKRLMVILKDGRVHNWLNVEKGRLPSQPTEGSKGEELYWIFKALGDAAVGF